MSFPPWIEKILQRKEINRNRLEEYVLVYKPWNAAQCLSLIEGAEEIGKDELVESILSVLLGVSSRLFTWDEKRGRFAVSRNYRLDSLNVDPLRDFLQQFAVLGTQYRIMWEWCEQEFHDNGDIFNAFRLALRDLLIKLSQHNFEARSYFKEKKINHESQLRLQAIPRWLDQDEQGKVLLTMRTLWSIYEDVTRPLKLPNVTDANFIEQIKNINLKQMYCSQTLVAIYRRIVIPNRQIRGYVYTMLDRCLQAFFEVLEQHLAQIETIEEIDFVELPFISSFSSDDEFFLRKYSPNEMKTFWNHFINLDLSQFDGLVLFDKEHFKVLADAIRCSFALQKNGLSLKHNLKRGSLAQKFQQELERLLQYYKHPEEILDIRTCCNIETFNCDIDEYYRFPLLVWKHFQPYRLPIRLTKDINAIMVEALAASFEHISRPIINEFLEHVVDRYRCLFESFAHFYLVQHPQPILQYVYFLFPELKNILIDRQYHRLESLLRSIQLNDVSDFALTLKVFQPSLYNLKRLETFPGLLELSVGIFDHIYFVPKFEAGTFEADASNFWPLTQLFNSGIIELYNKIFQYLLRLRFFMFLIGNDFIVSNAFKSGDLTKNNYLFRFRQSSMINQFAQQVEWKLREMVDVTIGRLQKRNVASFEELLEEHQRFLTRLEKIETGLVGYSFMTSLFKSVSKFTLVGAKDRRNNRRLSIQNATRDMDFIKPMDNYSFLFK